MGVRETSDGEDVRVAAVGISDTAKGGSTATELPEHGMKKLELAFRNADLNGDGFIYEEEMRFVFQTLVADWRDDMFESMSTFDSFFKHPVKTVQAPTVGCNERIVGEILYCPCLFRLAQVKTPPPRPFPHRLVQLDDEIYDIGAEIIDCSVFCNHGFIFVL